LGRGPVAVPGAVPQDRASEKGSGMPEADDDIDLEQVVWDPRYRREVIERLNRQAVQWLPEAAPEPRSGGNDP
jgi:hypothetical protein